MSFSVSRRFFGATAAGLLLALVTSTAALAAPRPITFDIFIGDLCVSGLAKSNSYLKVLIRDKSGDLKGRGAVETDQDGNWSACMGQGTRPMQPGDKVDVTDFETKQHRAFIVPLLTGVIDRGTNVVSGKAPTGSNIEVEAFDFRFDLWGEQYDSVQHVTALDGRFAYDFDNAGIDIMGGSRIVVRWTNGDDTVRTGRFQIAPYIVLALKHPDFAGGVGPNKAINITLRNGTTTVATGNAVGAYGDTTFYGDFADSDGETYRLVGGEMLDAPALGAQSSWRVPRINGRVDKANDSVSGSCFANGRYVVLASARGVPEQGFGFGTAAADGSFTLNLADQVDITRNFHIGILCYAPEGDELSQEFNI